MILSNTVLIICCLALFAQAWIKLCVLEHIKSAQTIAAILMIFGVCTVGGSVVVQQVVTTDWLRYGEAALCAATFLWLAGDRRRL